MVRRDLLPQHVYIEDGSHETREQAFKHYHFTMFCGDFESTTFPPLALVYSLAYVAHASRRVYVYMTLLSISSYQSLKIRCLEII